jgi:hypothetical protein
MTIDGSGFELAEPAYLWLLVAPAILCLLWSWRLLRRALDVRGHTRAQVVPRPHRFSAIGDLGFWFCIILASALCIVALGRPTVRIAGVPTSHTGLVWLVDNSASMRLREAAADGDLALTMVPSLDRQTAGADGIELHQELYWRFLCAAAVLVGAGTCLLRQPTELWWLALGAAAVILMIAVVSL